VAGIDVARAMGAAFGPGPDQVLFGTVASIATVAAFTVDVYLGNNAAGVSPSAATGLPYYSGYSPVVGDAVCILHGQGSSRSSYLVLGTVAGSSSGGGSAGQPIGTCVNSPYVITVPNWLLLNGGTFSATTYPVLYALNGMSTTLPDWRNVFPMGAGSIVSLGNTVGSQTANGLIAHTHAGPTHTHTDSGHTHSHSHTDSGHTHSHHHAPSNSTSFTTTAGGTIDSPAGGGFGFDATTTTDATSGSANLNTNNTSGTANLNNASGTTGSTGSGSSFSVLNPAVGVNWYVRAA
jgi:Phage Tail Collar Domain